MCAEQLSEIYYFFHYPGSRESSNLAISARLSPNDIFNASNKPFVRALFNLPHSTRNIRQQTRYPC